MPPCLLQVKTFKQRCSHAVTYNTYIHEHSCTYIHIRRNPFTNGLLDSRQDFTSQGNWKCNMDTRLSMHYL